MSQGHCWQEAFYTSLSGSHSGALQRRTPASSLVGLRAGLGLAFGKLEGLSRFFQVSCYALLTCESALTRLCSVHRADFWRCCPLAARVQAAHISAAHLVPVCRPGGQCRARRAWKPEGTACSRKVQARHGVRQPFCPLATLGTRVPSTAAPGGRGFPHWWFLKCLSRRQLLNYLLLQGLE